MLLRILVVAALVAFALEVAPPLLANWAALSAEIAQRKEFAANELPDLSGKYPTFMGPIMEENTEVIAHGRWPAIQRAWETNSIVRTVSGVASWVANNFFVRILSPQTPLDYAGLVAFLAAVAFAFYCWRAVHWEDAYSSIVREAVRDRNQRSKASLAKGTTAA